MTDKLALAEVQQAIVKYAAEIQAMFLPGAKITIIIRGIPGNNETDLLITDDEPAEAIAAINRRIDA